MSTVDVAASLIKRLTLEEWQALRGLEKCALNGTSTAAETIAKSTGQPLDRVAYALDELNKKNLVGRTGENHAIYTSAIDLLALKHYADKDYAYSLGKLIAKGKESDVYEVLSSKRELYALKFFRLGRTSFRDVTRKRASATRANDWILVNYQGAEAEFSAISRLAGVSPNLPTAVAFNRHTVLLVEIAGVRLSTRPEVVDPRKALAAVLQTVRDVYVKAGTINADLSEYNILTDGERVWLIDWPQSVRSDHPNAADLLKRDVSTVARFFKRSYGVAVDPEKALAFASGELARMPSIRRG